MGSFFFFFFFAFFLWCGCGRGRSHRLVYRWMRNRRRVRVRIGRMPVGARLRLEMLRHSELVKLLRRRHLSSARRAAYRRLSIL